MKKAKLQALATEMLKNYPELEEIYLTADGQGFGKRTDADAHAQAIRKDKIHVFTRETKEEVVSNPALTREDLVATYTDLFDKAPAHNMKLETMQNKIAEKQAELSKKIAGDSEEVSKTTASEEE